MLKHPFLLTFRASFLSSSTLCRNCQHRTLRTSMRLLADERRQPAVRAPIPRPQKDEAFEPKPLGRPIGFRHPPRPGENSGEDTRSWKQRRDDFVDYDKHIERRKELTARISKPYFRDFSNLRFHKGKYFLANNKMFKEEAALYFPNLRGITLEDNKVRDTTDALQGKISLVSVFSSVWGENQAKTFVGRKNTELRELLAQNEDIAQRVDINIEENTLKYWLIKAFKGGPRKTMARTQWTRYFIVQKGVSEEIRETIGLLNSKVGYVYLLDENCKIRWAASGDADEDEKEFLLRNLRRLVAHSKTEREAAVERKDAKPAATAHFR